MSSLFEIYTYYHHETTYTIIGKAKRTTRQYFKVEITHCSCFSNYENNQSCITVSDNNGEQYEIQVRFMDEIKGMINCDSPIRFSYIEHNIPPFVWCIITGMVISEL